MNDIERSDLLWIHYQKQIDENRAVGHALDELRKRLAYLQNQVNELMEHISVCPLGDKDD